MINWFARWRLNQLQAKSKRLEQKILLLRAEFSFLYPQKIGESRLELSWTKRKIAFWQEFLVNWCRET